MQSDILQGANGDAQLRPRRTWPNVAMDKSCAQQQNLHIDQASRMNLMIEPACLCKSISRRIRIIWVGSHAHIGREPGGDSEEREDQTSKSRILDMSSGVIVVLQRRTMQNRHQRVKTGEVEIEQIQQ